MESAFEISGPYRTRNPYFSHLNVLWFLTFFWSQARRQIKRMIFPIHHERNHWIIAVIDICEQSIIIYDSWYSTWEANHKKKLENMAHYKYIVVRLICVRSCSPHGADSEWQRLKVLVEKLASLPSVDMVAPDWKQWKINPHLKVHFPYILFLCFFRAEPRL